MMSVFGGTSILVPTFFWSGLLALLLWALASVVQGEPEKARVLFEKEVRIRRGR